jgi:hypothetical protein
MRTWTLVPAIPKELTPTTPSGDAWNGTSSVGILIASDEAASATSGFKLMKF